MLEKDIENLIANHPDEFFPASGFKLIGQQVRLGRCFADILFEDKFGRKIIVEVKRGLLSRDASGQVMEYYGLLKNEQPDGIVELILCANVIPAERKKFLETIGIECKELGLNSLNAIAAKYNYQFLDTKPKESVILNSKSSSIPQAERVWIFQANPNRYDILNALSDEKFCADFHWLVNQHKNEIRKGHLGLIWMSGSEAGIYALTEIISNPQFMRCSAGEDSYWTDFADMKVEKLRVKMRIIKNLVNRPITKNELKNLVGLGNLSIFRHFQGTNFQITPDEWEVIKGILFNRKE